MARTMSSSISVKPALPAAVGGDWLRVHIPWHNLPEKGR